VWVQELLQTLLRFEVEVQLFWDTFVINRCTEQRYENGAAEEKCFCDTDWWQYICCGQNWLLLLLEWNVDVPAVILCVVFAYRGRA